MMKYFLTYVVFSLAILTGADAQIRDSAVFKRSKELEVSFGAIYSKILLKDMTGINFKIEYSPTKRFETGIYFTSLSKIISDTFTYSIKQPIINFYQLGWTCQYNLLTRSKIKIGVEIVNALSVSRLGDKSIKETYRKRPKEIATSYLYTLSPGSQFSMRLTSSKRQRSVWLNANANYFVSVGKPKYASLSQYRGLSLALGVALRQFTDGCKHIK